jgi:L-threonylcarbamoyladenylate synthase
MLNTKVLPAESVESIPETMKTLQMGGLVVFPTDTVYGLAVPIHNQAGIDNLFEVKGRDFNKAIAVLIGGMDQIELLSTGFSKTAQKLAAAFWPGALTLVVDIRPGLPPNLSPYPTIGIRMPNHPFALSLLQKTGPLATTSANISGGSNTLTARQVLDQLDGKVDLVIDGGATPGAVPSTVVDCTKPELVILRQGTLTEMELRRALD